MAAALGPDGWPLRPASGLQGWGEGGAVTVPLLVDCDPGIDDAVALLLACASPEVRLLGVTTVSGNVGLEHTTRNALRLLTLAGRTDVPVPAVPVDPRHAVTLLADAVAGSAEPVTLVAVGPLTNVALFYAMHPELAA